MSPKRKNKTEKRKSNSGRRGKNSRKPSLAAQADRYDLYEQSVQSVDNEVEFLRETFAAIRRRKPALLREDFCGTAAAACEWVSVNRRHRAVGVDIDPEVLAVAHNRNAARLKPGARQRLQLVQANVLDAPADPVDLVVAFNFSYWIFRTRAQLRQYFASVRDALVDDGVFFLDAYGGSEAFAEGEEVTRHNGFSYVWDQASYDPVSGTCMCYIHFRFPDGSRLKRAFSYQWRLWTLPELRELLAEAGFSRATVYWQGADDDGEPDGVFLPVEQGEADPAWIAYIVAEK